MTKTRLALIGAGGLARDQHIPNITKSSVAELTVLCDLRDEALKEVSGRYPVGRCETDYRRVLEAEDIDGVVISTREDSHMALTLEALAAGKPVYVEKPLAETPEDAEKILRAQRASGLQVAVGLNRRCAPAYRYARDVMRKNGGAQNVFYRIADTYSSGWGERFGTGNRMFHELCHIFDILRFLIESEVEEVYCRSGRPDDESLLLSFESGATAMLLSSGHATLQTPKEHFEAVVAQGMVVVEEFVEVRSFGLPGEDETRFFPGHFHPFRDQEHVAEFKHGGYPALIAFRNRLVQRMERLKLMTPQDAEYASLREYVEERMPLINYAVDKGWQAAIDNFAWSIRSGGEQYTATAQDGLRATEITRAALRSRETGRPVRLGGGDFWHP